MTKRSLLICLGLVVLFLQTGCFSISERTDPGWLSKDVNYYRGTHFDYWILNSEGATTVGTVVCLIDLPFSFALDTILVPFDFTRDELNRPAPECATDTIKYAAMSGDLEKIKTLVKDKPDLVFSKDEQQNTPLHWAALDNKKDVVVFLLANNAEINAKNVAGWAPLHMALHNGHNEVANILRQHGGHE